MRVWKRDEKWARMRRERMKRRRRWWRRDAGVDRAQDAQ
jgi:hypothetical protein